MVVLLKSVAAALLLDFSSSLRIAAETSDVFFLPESKEYLGAGTLGVAYRLCEGPYVGRVAKVFQEEIFAVFQEDRKWTQLCEQEHAVNTSIHAALRAKKLDTRYFQQTQLVFDPRNSPVLLSDDLGVTLKTFLRERVLQPRQIFDLGRQLLHALFILHSAGYIHNDIDEENICILSSGDGTHHLKLIDFDSAKQVVPPVSPGFDEAATDNDICAAGFVLDSLLSALQHQPAPAPLDLWRLEERSLEVAWRRWQGVFRAIIN